MVVDSLCRNVLILYNIGRISYKDKWKKCILFEVDSIYIIVL